MARKKASKKKELNPFEEATRNLRVALVYLEDGAPLSALVSSIEASRYLTTVAIRQFTTIHHNLSKD